ncbi:hypothetical protein F373_gp022 [Bacillus phage SP-10]|uniref:hypothetical protein n=1 Tax=Bacillus phage SP10 TaxID=941058 RepID=UPI0002198AEA|nr:hypothetical protein F373_gp022 [Bacillus phage SP-10]BAK52834.1 hypothetical protein [Bacillus phage SP-10]
MELKKGDKVKIGSKYAEEYSYSPIVDREGVVTDVSTRGVHILGIEIDEGRGEAYKRIWFVRVEDCLPVDGTEEV